MAVSKKKPPFALKGLTIDKRSVIIMAEETSRRTKPAGPGGQRYQHYDKANGEYDIDVSSGGSSEQHEPNQGQTQSRYRSYADIKDRSIVSTTPQDFHSALSEAKESVRAEDRWRVDIHDLEDYESDKLFATPNGSCVAVESDGNIISVCKNQADKDIRGGDLIDYAVKNGGDRLDAFSGLYYFYAKKGFEPVSWVPFDEQYAPDGWSPAYKKEPVIFWKYTGKTTKLSMNDFLREVPASASYDEAKEIRDRSMKK